MVKGEQARSWIKIKMLSLQKIFLFPVKFTVKISQTISFAIWHWGFHTSENLGCVCLGCNSV
jgi:hypothetical protein